MAVTGLALTVVEILARDLEKAHTIRDISLRAKKAYANVHTTTTELINAGILTKQTIGHSHSCSLNMKSDLARTYLALVCELQRIKNVKRSKKLSQTIDQHREQILFAFEHDSTLIVVANNTISGLNARVLRPQEFLASNLWATTAPTILFGGLAYAQLLGVRK